MNESFDEGWYWARHRETGVVQPVHHAGQAAHPEFSVTVVADDRLYPTSDYDLWTPLPLPTVAELEQR